MAEVESYRLLTRLGRFSKLPVFAAGLSGNLGQRSLRIAPNRSGDPGWRVRSDVLLHGEEETGEVEEDRGGEADGVEAVEHSAVAFDQVAPVLHSTIALDRRHHQPAEKAHDRDQQRHRGGLPHLEWRQPPQAAAERGGGQNATYEALDGLRRRHYLRALWTTEQPAPHEPKPPA